MEPLDGEKYFFQQLLKEVPFRSFTELISTINMTKSFEEECILRNLWKSDEELKNENTIVKNVDLREEATKLFMKNNYETNNGKANIKYYYNENIFSLDNQEFEKESVLDINNIDDDQYDLKTYIRLNSNLISEINNSDKKLQTLSSDQSEVIDFIKTNLDNQMLIFLSGEGGCGKTYLIDIINNMLTMNSFNVRKLATTGNAATLIDGQTVHGFFSINYLLKCTLQYDSSKWHVLKETDSIIIDECSLMSDELLIIIDEILNRIYYDTNKSKNISPVRFGKKNIILVGDFLQLEAVSTFHKPITQLYKSMLFKDNFKPFI